MLGRGVRLSLGLPIWCSFPPYAFVQQMTGLNKRETPRSKAGRSVLRTNTADQNKFDQKLSWMDL